MTASPRCSAEYAEWAAGSCRWHSLLVHGRVGEWGFYSRNPDFGGLQETLSLSGRSTRRQHVGVSYLGLCGSGAVGNLAAALAAAVATPSAQVSASCRAPSARRQSAGQGAEGRGRLIALDLIDARLSGFHLRSAAVVVAWYANRRGCLG